MSNHNLCFRAKIRKKNVYPCTPQFHYIKVGCKGVFITRTCYHDEQINDCGRASHKKVHHYNITRSKEILCVLFCLVNSVCTFSSSVCMDDF